MDGDAAKSSIVPVVGNGDGKANPLIGILQSLHIQYWAMIIARIENAQKAVALAILALAFITVVLFVTKGPVPCLIAYLIFISAVVYMMNLIFREHTRFQVEGALNAAAAAGAALVAASATAYDLGFQAGQQAMGALEQAGSRVATLVSSITNSLEEPLNNTMTTGTAFMEGAAKEFARQIGDIGAAAGNGIVQMVGILGRGHDNQDKA